jgi:hypothetical protein
MNPLTVSKIGQLIIYFISLTADEEKMKKIKDSLSTIAAVCVLAPIPLLSTIIESDRIAALQPYAESDTLIFCDIDNTLFESAVQVGSIQWSGYMTKKAEKAGYSANEADEVSDKFWIFAQLFVPVRYVDPETPHVLLALKRAGIRIFGLTARYPIEVGSTKRQLSSLDIDLRSPYYPEDFSVLPLPHPSVYDEGVIYCGSNEKSAALVAFLRKANFFPKRIVFIDDRLHHVKDLERVVTDMGIEFVGIRFSGADAHVKAFDSNIAELQWSHLPEIISDQEASHRIEALSPKFNAAAYVSP